MRAVLLTHGAGPRDLRKDLELWKEHHGKAPDLIVGERELAYGLVNEPEFTRGDGGAELDRWNGIALLDLADLWEAEAEFLGEREPTPDNDEENDD